MKVPKDGKRIVRSGDLGGDAKNHHLTPLTITRVKVMNSKLRIECPGLEDECRLFAHLIDVLQLMRRRIT